jgi:hydroxymethylglutaryl-CoA lyase
MIELVEVGPRDGLQSEAVQVSTADKVALLGKLVAAGLRRIEAVSFVNPQRVPQMADAEAVLRSVAPQQGVTYIGLVLNMKGALRALRTEVDQLGTLAVASDTFGVRNQKQTVAESVDAAKSIMRLAREHGRTAQTSIAMAFGCPFEGRIPKESVVELAKQLSDAQPIEIGLADTIGVAVPSEVGELVTQVREAIWPIPVRVHFHNTRNTAIANVWAAVQAGATAIDAAIGGIGGCPFAPQATGNVATEDVVYLLNHSHLRTDVQLDALIETAHWCAGVLGRQLPGMVSRAGDFPAQFSGVQS